MQALITLPGEPNYSNPVLLNNIIYNNRSFFNDASLNGGAGGLAPNPSGPYWDLAVINAVGSPPALNPDDCILSALTGPNGENYDDSTNFVADPGFVLNYVNTLQTATVIDEGGNNINVLFSPLNPAAGNYHITTVSPAIDQGNDSGAPTTDYDAAVRSIVDIGADEMVTPIIGTVVINNGAAATNSRSVALTFSATSTDGAVTGRRLSWNNGATWSGWKPYTANAAPTIPKGLDGIKTVSVQFRDVAGNVSLTYTDTIILDRVVPTGEVVINGGAASTANRDVTLTFSATDTATPVTKMRWSWTNAAWGPWVDYATSANARITGGSGKKTIRVQYRDAAGNVSSTYIDSILFQP